MRTLAHLSDLHFGRTDPVLVHALHHAIDRIAPDLVIISGDFTQRATIGQYLEAQRFIERLPVPVLAVPGNHDVPLYNAVDRFTRPLANYHRYISSVTEPYYSDAELVIVCVNTARSLAFKGGRINRQQVDRVCRELAAGPEHAVKILVAHHPLDLPDSIQSPLVGRARMALARLASSGLDMILSGHLHVTYFPVAAEKLQVGGHAALLVQAGTAVSTRGRGQVNSFNRIVTEPDRIEVTQFCWSPTAAEFEACVTAGYSRAGNTWVRQ